MSTKSLYFVALIVTGFCSASLSSEEFDDNLREAKANIKTCKDENPGDDCMYFNILVKEGRVVQEASRPFKRCRYGVAQASLDHPSNVKIYEAHRASRVLTPAEHVAWKSYAVAWTTYEKKANAGVSF